MIISKTPFRISLFGGGTDYPAWYLKHGGSVIGTTINKYCYLSVSRLQSFFDHKYRIVWSKIEDVECIDQIQHPAVKAILTDMEFQDEGLEISYRGDLPARSGLGTSSSFIVGLINALYTLRNEHLKSRDLASKAIRMEREVLQEAVGSQDQIWASYGGFNLIEFFQDGSFSVSTIDVRGQTVLEQSLMLFFTGFTRTASKIAEKQIANFPYREYQMSRIGDICKAAKVILKTVENPIEEIGELMHHSWMMKIQLANGVSTLAIDDVYSRARAAGAIGGKLLGAGGGGFLLFVVKPEDQTKVKEALKKLVHVPFGFDTMGSSILVKEP